MRITSVLFLIVVCGIGQSATFSVQADRQRLGPGQKATLTASGNDKTEPQWLVKNGNCKLSAGKGTSTEVSPPGSGAAECEVEGSVTRDSGTSSDSKQLSWSSFSVLADKTHVEPGGKVNLSTTQGKKVLWSVTAPSSRARALTSAEVDNLEQTVGDSASCQAEVWTFRGADPHEAKDYAETDVAVVCPVGMEWHAVAGVEQGQAAGSDRIFRLSVDLGVNFPLPLHHNSRVTSGDGFFGRRSRVWANFRVTSAPQQLDSTLPNAIKSIDSAVKTLKLSDVAQAAEVLGGWEFRLAETEDTHLSIGGTHERFSVHALVAAGFTTAFANGNPVTLYQDLRCANPSPVNSVCPQGGSVTAPANAPQYYAVVRPTDTSVYPGQYYGGLRFKTYYFDDANKLLNITPSTIDLMFGHDAAGSRENGVVPTLRADAFFSFPTEKVNFLHFFVTVIAKLDHPFSDVDRNNPGLVPFLQSIGFDSGKLADPHTIVLQDRGVNRDFYRFGVGIDVWRLLEKAKALNPKTGS